MSQTVAHTVILLINNNKKNEPMSRTHQYLLAEFKIPNGDSCLLDDHCSDTPESSRCLVGTLEAL